MNPAPPTTTDLDIHYISGFFDGGGCIVAPYNKAFGVRSVALSVSQKHPEVLQLIQRFWGFGTISVAKRTGVSVWSVSGAKNCVVVLDDMRPWLVVKAAVAEIAIELCERILAGAGRGEEFRSGAPLSDEEREIRAALGERISQLNSGRGKRKP